MQTSSSQRILDYNTRGWWDNQTLFDLYQHVVGLGVDRVALIDPPNRSDLVFGTPMRISYKEMPNLVDQFTEWFYAKGLRQGDKIFVQLPNTVEIVLLYLAAARLGLIVSPIAVQYGKYELAFMRDVVKPKAYIAFRNFKGDVFGEANRSVFVDDCEVLLLDEAGFNLADAPPLSQEAVDYVSGLFHDPNDIFTICWTSGTTGRSKGVPRSHNQWLASALACEDSVNLPQGSVFLNPFPFINMAAIGGFLYFWLKNQGTMVLHHPFDGPTFLNQLQNEKVVYTIAPPALLNRLVETKDQIKAVFDLSNLKLIGSGSAPLSPHMLKGFKDAFDIDVVNVFGSNEGAALLSGPRDVIDPKERALFFPRFGRPEFEWPNRISNRLKTKLLNLETGIEVTEPGVSGELCILGATVFDGYYNSETDNKTVFTEDGYFRTGDLFAIAGDNQQYYRFTGRCKALIIRGGVNISPEEIDELLISHPDISEAAVTGFPDKVMGEKICAFVVPIQGQTLTLKDITGFFAQKSIAKFKWPEKLVLLKALPRNPMNKVVRGDLEKILEECDS